MPPDAAGKDARHYGQRANAVCYASEPDYHRNSVALSRQAMNIAAIFSCQGPWNVDLRTPPGPEGSNGSLLRICRGHPGISNFEFLILSFEFRCSNLKLKI